MSVKKKFRIIPFLVSLLMMTAVFQITANANEYFDISNLTDKAVFELGSEIEFSVTPRRFVGSKWSSWSNYPNFVYVRIYKDSDTEPCKSSTFSYNTNGASVGTFPNIYLPGKVGEKRTVSFTPDAEGKYTVKMLWQNYDDKYDKKDPALIEEFTFTVKTAEEAAGSSAAAEASSGEATAGTAENASDPSKTETAEEAAAPTVTTSSKEVKDLPAVTISKPKAAKKAAAVKWKKISSKIQKKITGVEIQYSLDRKFSKGVKTKTAKKTAVSKKITKLKSKKTYYIRIRTYKKIKGVKHVSKWSAVKAVKVK